jgi:LacI family transcriptional regulator
MDSINLKKLAEQLNLSISTVSKAFRNSYDINPSTRDRILSLARELNYQPNPLASSLRTQKSKTIAVIIPEIANNFFTLAINGIESVAQEKGYHVLIYLTHEDPAKEVAFTHHLQSGRVDGVLISLSGGAKDYLHLDFLRQKGIPIVFFDRIYEDCNTTKVTTNDFDSGYKATEHLIEQGCKKIAHLSTSKNLSISEKRLEGYQQALINHGMVVDKKLIIHCSNQQKNDYRLIKNLLEKNKPDGIFSSFEKLAVLTYQVCEDLQVKIPQQLKIISFSNLETAALLHPSLTTITQPAFEIGKRSASVLFKALDKKSWNIPNEHIIVDSVLIKRKSTEKSARKA